ncbi:MAG: hypothetical protein WAT79_06545 [Saprospiraceae bacterium]
MNRTWVNNTSARGRQLHHRSQEATMIDIVNGESGVSQSCMIARLNDLRPLFRLNGQKTSDSERRIGIAK